MNGRIDLHIHSSYSDGLSTPPEVLNIVKSKRLGAFAICDHDNIEAYFELKKVLNADDPDLVPGVELSAGQGGEDIHILGYFYNPDSKILIEALKEFRENRNRRGERMLKELKRLGIELPVKLVYDFAGNSAIGRPHIADALVRVGAVRNYNEAFGRFIGVGCPAYIPKENLTPHEAIKLIHEAGGLAFLAHPGIADAGRYIPEFEQYGLDGIEIYHSRHSSSLRKSLIRTADKNMLLKSGGSDYHGRDGQHEMIGSQNVPMEYLNDMRRKLGLKIRGIN